MPIRSPRLLEENVVDGIYYSIHDVGLRYTTLLKVHINGKETYHRSISDANTLLYERGCKQPPKTPAERLQEASEAMVKEHMEKANYDANAAERDRVSDGTVVQQRDANVSG